MWWTWSRDVVRPEMGMVVSADVRLLAVERLECDESVLTGESAAVTKTTEPTEPGAPLCLAAVFAGL